MTYRMSLYDTSVIVDNFVDKENKPLGNTGFWSVYTWKTPV